MIGILTSAVFLGIGASLYTEEQPLVGGVLLFLGSLRGVVAAIQIRNAFLAGEDHLAPPGPPEGEDVRPEDEDSAGG